MKRTHFIVACNICLAMLVNTCKNETKSSDLDIRPTTIPPDIIVKDTTSINNASNSIHYDEETTNDATAEKLKTFLKDYLKKDVSTLPKESRNFTFYEVDLNKDNKNEYFIRLSGSSFCESGGCTFLLLDNTLKHINRFTGLKGPVFISSHSTNGWNDLILHGKEKDKFIYLEWDSKSSKYPSNPSVIAETDFAPSGHDYIMWNDEFSRAKVFEF